MHRLKKENGNRCLLFLYLRLALEIMERVPPAARACPRAHALECLKGQQTAKVSTETRRGVLLKVLRMIARPKPNLLLVLQVGEPNKQRVFRE